MVEDVLIATVGFEFERVPIKFNRCLFLALIQHCAAGTHSCQDVRENIVAPMRRP